MFQMFPTVYRDPVPLSASGDGPATGTRAAESGRTASNRRSRGAVERGMPPEIAARARSIGARIEAQRTAELYAPLQPKEPYAWLSVTRDVQYGAHERNVLDVFTTPDPGSRQARGRVRARRRLRARRQAYCGRLAVLRQRVLWAVGATSSASTLNYRLAPEQHVAVRHRGSDGQAVDLAQGQRRALSAAIRARFCSGDIPPAPRTSPTTSRRAATHRARCRRRPAPSSRRASTISARKSRCGRPTTARMFAHTPSVPRCRAC